MIKEPNQAQEIFEFIFQSSKPVCVEDIVQGTRWNRHLVEVATKLLVEAALIEEVKTEWGDPVYMVMTRRPSGADRESEPDHSDITDEMGTR